MSGSNRVTGTQLQRAARAADIPEDVIKKIATCVSTKKLAGLLTVNKDMSALVVELKRKRDAETAKRIAAFNAVIENFIARAQQTAAARVAAIEEDDAVWE